MSRSFRSLLVVLAASTASALGCVTVQDLGSHPPAAVGAPDGGFPWPFESGPPGKIFFVTKGRYRGDLGTEGGAPSGPAGGDSVCTREAREAGHGGLFKAWLSTSTENAKSRIAAVGPWRSLGSALVPFPGAAVTDPPANFLGYTADGTELFFEPDRLVWTGTKSNGTRNDNGDTCNMSVATYDTDDSNSTAFVTCSGGASSSTRGQRPRVTRSAIGKGAVTVVVNGVLADATPFVAQAEAPAP